MATPPDDSTFLAAFANGERTLPVPVRLNVTIDNQTHALKVDEVMRLLPGKRVVFRGSLEEQAVAVKFFVRSTSSARHIARERAGYERVRMAGLPCPRILGHCLSPCGRFEGLIFDFINDARDLAQCWQHFDVRRKRYWLRRLVMAMLQLHQRAGAYQQDIHLGNFLLRGDELYVLDLGSIATRSAPLPQASCIDNLGQLVAQLDIGERPLIDDAIADYFVQCGWPQSAKLQQTLQRSVQKAWDYRLRDYLGKARRDCTLTRFEHSFERVLAVRRTWEGDDLQRFVADPDRFMAAGELLKAGNTATVVKALLDGRPVVIKRYNIKNWRHAVSRSLRRSRAEHSWRMAHLLEIMGIASLKPIALLERRYGPLHGTAYFVSTWIDAPDLLAVGAQRALTEAELVALRTLLLQIVACRLSHGDFKANNLLLDSERIALIDLDAMQRLASPQQFWRSFRKDLARLQRNWPSDSAVFTQIRPLIEEIIALQALVDSAHE